jgi:hypothetical protein
MTLDAGDIDIAPHSPARLRWLHSCDRDLLSWFCTKYAKDTCLSYFSHGRSSFVCLYQQYKGNLKNVSKRHFDCKSSSCYARDNFFTWCIHNDADIYLRENLAALSTEYTEHKRGLYVRYKHILTTSRNPKTKAHTARGKDRLMARDTVYNVKSTLVM